MLLFLLSVGLSVTLGLMNFVNLAHCAFAMLGGYVTVTLMNHFGWRFLATLPVAFLAAAAVSVVFERMLYRRLYRASDLDQVLLTIGLAFISVAAPPRFFGTTQQPIDMPAYLRGSFNVLGLNIAAYRLFLIGVALVVTLLLVAGLEYTRFGAQVRAAVDNQRMARGLASMSTAPSPSPSRSAAGSPASAARSPSRSSASIRISPSPIWSMC